MYTDINFKSKAALKRALKEGKKITVFQPNDMFSRENTNPDLLADRIVSLEGPHYPAPHSWYGQGVIRNGFLVKIK